MSRSLAEVDMVVCRKYICPVIMAAIWVIKSEEIPHGVNSDYPNVENIQVTVLEQDLSSPEHVPVELNLRKLVGQIQ